MKKLVVLAVVAGVILVGAACGPAAMKLPDDAIKLTDVIPGMGEHWANPANMPLGPIYLVYEEKVIGIEYMWSEDMMQEVTIPTPEGDEHFLALAPLPVGVVVDHVDIAYMEHGHEGFDVPHSDVHMYFITVAEKNAIAP